MMYFEEEIHVECLACQSILSHPYIKCAECQLSTLLCLHCFAQGFENDTHKSNHAYEIVRKDFPLFDDHWTAAEEGKLLQGVFDCGLGNWVDIASQVVTKTKEQCEEHYMKYYVEEASDPLPVFPEAEFKPMPQPIVFKLSDDPPRPMEHSNMYIDMAGYLAARSEFSMEHDNYVELDLRHMTLDDPDCDEMEQELKIAVLEIYHRCLQQRQKRKQIVRKYGLINLRKVHAAERRSEKNLKQFMDTLRSVMRLLPPENYDQYMEGLNYEQELKEDIDQLQGYRSNGLTHIRHIKVYNLLKNRRDIQKPKRHLLSDILGHLQDQNACQFWLQRQAALNNISKGFTGSLPSAPRKSAPPLDIVGLPGYEKLLDEEKDLCTSVRLVPDAYLEFKRILITEYTKLGSLKLAQARALIKIDVNKTRRIYDFLLSGGFIKKDSG